MIPQYQSIEAIADHLGLSQQYTREILDFLRAMNALEKRPARNVHYSSVLSLAEDDIEQIRTLFLDMLEKSEKILKNSKDEVLCGFNFDLFHI